MTEEYRVFDEYLKLHPYKKISNLKQDREPRTIYVIICGNDNTMHHNARYKLKISLP